MLIYKDIFTGDELASDSFPVKLVDGIIYEFTGKFVSRKDDDIVLSGSNPSAEEAEEGAEECVAKGIDIVMNHQLNDMTEIYSSLASFKDWVKEYLKKLVDRMKEEGKKDADIADFKKKMQEWVAGLLKKDRFKELQFYSGSGECAVDGQLMIIEWRDIGGEQKPVGMLVKAGLEEEKC